MARAVGEESPVVFCFWFLRSGEGQGEVSEGLEVKEGLMLEPPSHRRVWELTGLWRHLYPPAVPRSFPGETLGVMFLDFFPSGPWKAGWRTVSD